MRLTDEQLSALSAIWERCDVGGRPILYALRELQLAREVAEAAKYATHNSRVLADALAAYEDADR